MTAVSTSSGVSGQTGPPGPTTSPRSPTPARAVRAAATAVAGRLVAERLRVESTQDGRRQARVPVDERRQIGSRGPADDLGRPRRDLGEGNRPRDVDDPQRRPGVESGQDRAIVRLEEVRVRRRPQRRLGGDVHRVEHPRQALGQTELGEAGLGLGEGPERVADEARPLSQVGGEPAAAQAGREGRRRRERHDDRRVADAPVEPYPDQGLHDLAVAWHRGGIDRTDRPPVLGPRDGAAGAGAAAVGAGRLGLDAAPGLGCISGRRDHPQEIRPVPVVEAERRLGEARRRAIRRGEVAPERIRGSVDGLPPDRGAEALKPSHGRHRRRS